MKLTDLLSPESIKIPLEGRDKQAVIEEMVDLLIQSQQLSDRQATLDAIWKREELMSTGIGNGIAIPHGKSKGGKDLVMAFGMSPRGIGFDSLDGQPVHICFLLVAPENVSGPHVRALARISRLLQHNEFRQALLQCSTAEQVFQAITTEEKKHI
ncbi:PTS sugar transporter subunit IIA [candidate division KSB1 bacterium]